MRKILFIVCIILFFVISLIWPQVTIQGAVQGLNVWFFHLLPSLLPFIIISNIMMQSHLFSYGTNRTRNLKVQTCITIVVTSVCGLLCGLPIGAVLINNCRKEQILSRKQAQFLLPCCNMLSPFFVSGYLLTKHLNAAFLIPFTFFCMYLPPLIGILLTMCSTFFLPTSHDIEKPPSRFHLSFQIIDAGIMNGFEIITKLGGYIILFTISGEFLSKIPMLSPGICSCLHGLLEISGGIHLMSEQTLPFATKYMLLVILTIFGGFCTHAQTYTILSESGLSKMHYTIAKLLLSLISLTLLYTLYPILY